MKALTYISLIIVLILTSCTQSLYMGAENDDLYYRPSDQIVVIADNREIAGEQEVLYYDEFYDADTLVADFYYDRVDQYGMGGQENVASGDPFIYYDDFSYASRINRFHGNYLYPYWRDPWYNPYLFSSPSFYMGYGFGYRPHYYSRYGHYDPFFYDPFFYSSIHSSYYYGYYPRSYSVYSPYYYGYGSGSPYYGWSGSTGRDYSTPVARRQTYSTVSDRYLAGTGTNRAATTTSAQTATASRRTGDYTTVTAVTGNESRRTGTTITDAGQRAAYQTHNQAAQVTTDANRRSTATTGTASTMVVSRPAYVSADRSYTPTYNNPRVTTRPSYNTSRANATTIIPSGTNTRTNNTVQTNVRTQTSVSTTPVRSGTISTGTSTINRTINSVIPSVGTRANTSTGTSTISTGTGSTGRTSTGTSSVSTGRTSTSTSTSTSTGSTGRTTSTTTSTGRTGGR